MIDREALAAGVLTNHSLSMPARTIFAWVATRKDSVTISDVVQTMFLSRVSASAHLNALEKSGLLVRFLPNGGRAEHHWRIVDRA